MKKIGILTLSASDNCGSLLQTYALRKILAQDNAVEVINFSSEKSHDMYDIFPRRVRKQYWEIVKRVRYIGELWGEKRAYKEFREKYLNMKLGKEYFSKDLKEIEDKYELLVTGSDQIWNVCMGDFDTAFFAGWSKSKKVAYAPSLGGYDIRLSKECDEIVKCLNEFSMISAREKLGQQCLQELSDKDVTLVLDPTLLIQRQEWEKLIGEPIVKGDYIFYYSWAYWYEDLSQIVSNDAKKENLPVYVIDAHKFLHRRTELEKWNLTLCKEAGPLAFLNLMYYANKCYLESFHGLVFAYLFQKNFWVLNLTEDLETDDIRLFELTKLFDAENRVICKDNVERKNLAEPFEYKENKKLDSMRQQSLDYIKKMLEV